MFGELYNTVKVIYGKAGSTQSMSECICVNTKIKGKPFSFDGYPLQKAIADDMHPVLSVIKCSQVRAIWETGLAANVGDGLKTRANLDKSKYKLSY